MCALRSGLNDRREVLTSQDALLDQQYVLKALEADHLFAMVDLIQALGGGYSNGIESVPSATGAGGGPLGLGDQNARMGIGQSGFPAFGRCFRNEQAE